MPSRVMAVAQTSAGLKLGLSGMPVHEVETVDEAEKLLRDLLDSKAQVLVVDEVFRDGFSEWFKNRLARHSGLPLVIFCPSFTEEDANTDAYINSIVRPAVGFEIRLD